MTNGEGAVDDVAMNVTDDSAVRMTSGRSWGNHENAPRLLDNGLAAHRDNRCCTGNGFCRRCGGRYLADLDAVREDGRRLARHLAALHAVPCRFPITVGKMLTLLPTKAATYPLVVMRWLAAEAHEVAVDEWAKLGLAPHRIDEI